MNDLMLSLTDEKANADKAKSFCSLFCSENNRPKYLFGRNVYAEKIVKNVDITGFVDDFTEENFYLDLPIIKSEKIPTNALVLIIVGGRPHSAKQKIEDLKIECLDYFSFYKLSGLPLTDVIFNEGFEADFQKKKSEYDWVYNLLSDETSREVFKKLVNFRLKYDLDYLKGFTSREEFQYFEDFLDLKPEGESFADVGVFDGYTSLEFIKHCPGYRAIHLFEPDAANFDSCEDNLRDYKNIHLHKVGLSNEQKVLKFSPQGSGSTISEHGSVEIPVDRLDSVLNDEVTFIKMDIEGSELDAIEGAVDTISTFHPKLAICVYHNVGDFWKIPKRVLAIRSDYKIYLRHYTESIYETVMFFVPVS